MESKDTGKNNSSGSSGKSLTMAPQSKRHKKTNESEATASEIVELNMTDDVVPLQTSALTYEFMKSISTIQDTQLVECIPNTLKLLKAFRETKGKDLAQQIERDRTTSEPVRNGHL